MEKAAEEGNSFAQYQVGKMYNDGVIVARNEAKAIYWLDRASKQNNEFAYIMKSRII